MTLTVPQLILLNHAAWVNRERADKKYKRDKKKESGTTEPRSDPQDNSADEELNDEGVPTWNGVPLSKLNSKQMALYYGSFFQGQ